MKSLPIPSNENLEIDPVDESSAPSTSKKRSRYRSPIWTVSVLHVLHLSLKKSNHKVINTDQYLPLVY